MLVCLPEITQHQRSVIIEHIPAGSRIGAPAVKIVTSISSKISMLCRFKDIRRSILQRERETAFQPQPFDNLPVDAEQVGQVIIARFISDIQWRIIQWIVNKKFIASCIASSVFCFQFINIITVFIFVFYVRI